MLASLSLSQRRQWVSFGKPEALIHSRAAFPPTDASHTVGPHKPTWPTLGVSSNESQKHLHIVDAAGSPAAAALIVSGYAAEKHCMCY